jgi:AraC-like DNA-binding protein
MVASNQVTEDAFRYYDRLERVRQYVITNLEKPLSLADIARVAGTERKYFSAFFGEKTGSRLSVWLHHVRLKAAKNLLRARNHTIADVAVLVGYRDLGTFERNFKRYVGMTPRDFKNHVRPSQGSSRRNCSVPLGNTTNAESFTTIAETPATPLE